MILSLTPLVKRLLKRLPFARRIVRKLRAVPSIAVTDPTFLARKKAKLCCGGKQQKTKPFEAQHAKILASTRANGNTKPGLFLFLFVC